MPTDDPRLPAASHVGRVSHRVGDLEGLADFYASVVGLERLPDADASELAEGDRESVLLGAGGGALLRLVADPDAPPRGREQAGLFHVAFRVPSRAALGGALERITERSALTGASDHHVSEALYLRDPEGNGVEVYCDRPVEAWPTRKGRVRMDTLPLDTDELRTLSDGGESVPAGTDVGHVHLEVTSLAAARDFYVDALGLNVRQEWGPGALFVAAGDYHHHVGLNTWNGRSAPAGGRGLDWFELVVPDDSALDECRRRLEDAGHRVTDLAVGVEVRDPDDIGIRVRVED